MLIKEEGIKNLLDVIERFKRWDKESRLNNEDDVKDLVYELFERVLGWDKDDIYRERHPGPTSKRADFQFKDKGIIKLILETKAINVAWTQNTFSQAIGYGWGANKEYVVLTNFKSLILFNAKWKDRNKMIFEIENIEDCITSGQKFDFLWLLSKESFLTGKIDEFSESIGKKLKKAEISTIDKQLLNDLKKWRETLTKDIKSLNKISEEEVDEVVQKIINRLIFIRVCEDRGLEPTFAELRSHLRIWSEKKVEPLLKHLLFVFNHYDSVYDGTIFKKDDLCEKVEIHNNVLEKIIEQLYIAQDVGVEYNFASIDADVLGSVYEEYLGYLLKGKKITENHAHRKEQGIYYTPTYIVDYIVRSTLGEVLKQSKEIDKIKVLDPACGSGSFLIKAFDVISEFYKERIGEDKFNRQIKNNILTQNIYGVDLDPKAVEIAQLNLFLKIGEKGELPTLRDNIKNGNSLIDDPKISNKYFKWEEEFEEIMKEDRFNVVIGNPPWVSIKGKQKSIDISEDELNYLFKKYPCDKYRPNLFEMFIWKCLSLVKDEGYFGFIVPDRLCYNAQFIDLRKYILENFTLKKLWFRPVFEGVISDNVIFIIRNEKPNEKSKVEIAEYPSTEFKKIPQMVYTRSSDFAWFIVDEKILSIFEKIRNKKEMFELEKRFKSNVGFIAIPNKVMKTKQSSKQIKVFKGENIVKFGTKSNYFFEFKKDNLAGGTQDEEKLSKKNKVFLRKTGSNIIASFDDSGTYPEQSVYFVYINEDKNDIELKFLCGLLNSKLLNCYYRNFAVTNRDATPQLKKIDLDKFPIILSDDLTPMIKLVDKITMLTNHLNEIEDKNNEKEDIEDEIKKINKKIDKLVYKTYGLTEDEIKIIEENSSD